MKVMLRFLTVLVFALNSCRVFSLPIDTGGIIGPTGIIIDPSTDPVTSAPTDPPITTVVVDTTTPADVKTTTTTPTPTVATSSPTTSLAPVTTTSTKAGIVPAVSYATVNTFYIGVDVKFVPTVTGGSSPIVYTVDTTLPAGLTLSKATGIVTGKPTAVTTTSVFFIFTATNSAGSDTNTVQITVVQPSFVYNPASLILSANTTITVPITTLMTPLVGLTAFTVQPPLPAGLVLSLSDGSITGTPRSVIPQTNFVVTGTNFYGGIYAQILPIEVTSVLGNASIFITNTGGHLTAYAGLNVYAAGTATSMNPLDLFTLSASVGVLVQNRVGDTVNWSWSLLADAFTPSSVTITAVSSSGASAVPLVMSIFTLNSPPSFTLNNVISLLKDGAYANSGTWQDNKSSGVNMYSNIGALTKGSMTTNDWSWTLLETARKSNSYVIVTAVDSQGGTAMGSFFLQQDPNIPITGSNIVFTFGMPIPLNSFSDSDKLGIILAVGRVTKTTASIISSKITNASSRFRNLQATAYSTPLVTVTVTISNVPSQTAGNLVDIWSSSVRSGAFLKELQTNYYSGVPLNQIFVTNNPSSVTITVNQSNAPGGTAITLPVWLLAVIIVAAVFLIILSIYLVRKYCVGKYDNQTGGKYDSNGDMLAFPKKASASDINYSRRSGRMVHEGQPLIEPETPLDAGEIDTQIIRTNAVTGAVASTAAVNAVVGQLPEISVFVHVQPTGMTTPIRVSASSTARQLKFKILDEQVVPTVKSVDEFMLLMGGKLIPDAATLSSAGVMGSTTIHVVLSKRKTVDQGVKKTASSKRDLGDFLNALPLRNNSDTSIRRSARRKLAASMIDGDDADQMGAISSLLDMEVAVHRETLDFGDNECWIPLDDDADADSLFAVGAAKSLQRTENYTLIGKTKVGGSEIQQGLVTPLNYKNDGNMEGVNSIVWQAVCKARTVVIKGMLPFSTIEGYENEFASHDSEYKIPLSIPAHPNVIPILHQFVGSSALVYPWITEEVRNLNLEMLKVSGRRFIRRYTTYIVMEYYPLTLRKYFLQKEIRNEVISERELCFLALQLISAADHLRLHRVAHRDIKDDNIFIDKSGRLVLADFGCSISCKNMIYQSINDLTTRIGSSVSIAPEVHAAIKKGPSNEPAQLWEVLKCNDIYAIGSLLYRALGVNIPSSFGTAYSDAAIPRLPPRFSAACDNFFRKLIAFRPKDRISTRDAMNHLEVLLWGPSMVSGETYTESSMSAWLRERRLDLVFSVSDDSVGNDAFTTMSLGSSNENVKWPLTKGIQRESCVKFLQKADAERILTYY